MPAPLPPLPRAIDPPAVPALPMMLLGSLMAAVSGLFAATMLFGALWPGGSNGVLIVLALFGVAGFIGGSALVVAGWRRR